MNNVNGYHDSMTAQEALDELRDYLLGEDWYITDPVNREQANAIIVDEIENKFGNPKYKIKRKFDLDKFLNNLAFAIGYNLFDILIIIVLFCILLIIELIK